jgi:hypothetical protein
MIDGMGAATRPIPVSSIGRSSLRSASGCFSESSFGICCQVSSGSSSRNVELDRIHFPDYRSHLVFGEGVQQNKRVVVREDGRQLSRKFNRKTAEENLLIFVRQAHERVCRNSGVEALQDGGCPIQSTLREDRLNLFGFREFHLWTNALRRAHRRRVYAAILPNRRAWSRSSGRLVGGMNRRRHCPPRYIFEQPQT